MTAYKSQLRATWDGLGPAWHHWQEFFDRGASSVTDWLVDAGGIRAGDRVLDVATGAGEPALTVAECVGPTGYVLGVDQSPLMLDAARTRAHGRSNVEFRVDDADALSTVGGEAYDVVLSRFGLMFAPDLGRTLAAIAGVLDSGGRFAASTWSEPSRAPVVSLAFGVAARLLELPPPPPGTPGPFTMADPEPVLAAMRSAGFVDERFEEIEVVFHAGSVEEFVDYCRATLPRWLTTQVEERFGAERSNPVWFEVANVVAPYVDAHGAVALPSVANCFRGIRS